MTSYLKTNTISLVLVNTLLKKWATEKFNDNYSVKDDVPVVWLSKFLDICTHIDTIMHLVFLDVTQKLGMIVKNI